MLRPMTSNIRMKCRWNTYMEKNYLGRYIVNQFSLVPPGKKFRYEIYVDFLRIYRRRSLSALFACALEWNMYNSLAPQTPTHPAYWLKLMIYLSDIILSQFKVVEAHIQFSFLRVNWLTTSISCFDTSCVKYQVTVVVIVVGHNVSTSTFIR